MSQSPAIGSRYMPSAIPPSSAIAAASSWIAAGGVPSTSSAGLSPRESAFFLRRGAFFFFAAMVSPAHDALGERRHLPHQSRVQGELGPMIPLLADGMVDPRELAALLAVEARVILPQRQLALIPERLLAFLHLRPQQREQLGLGGRLVGGLRVHAEQFRPRRPVQVGVGPR